MIEEIEYGLEVIYDRYVPKKYFIPILLISISSLVLAVGLYDSPISPIRRGNDLHIDPEYLNGVLTASGVLFGFWAILMEKRLRKPEPPKDTIDVLKLEVFSRGMTCFFVALVFLIASIVYVCLTALNLFSSEITLIFEVVSFAINASFLALTVYDLGTIYDYYEEKIYARYWDETKAE